MKLLYGKPIADGILAQLKAEIVKYAQKPGLAVILVGEDAASKIYVGLKEKRALEIGMDFFRYDLPANTSNEELSQLVDKLNKDEKVHGIIVQLPLPQGLEAERIIQTIAPQKDADGFLNKENSSLQPVFPAAILQLIASSGQQLQGKKALVVANSTEFGTMMAKVLHEKGLIAEYVLAGDFPADPGQIGSADVVVSAVGSPGLLRGEMFKEGAIVVDGGIEKVASHVVGDVDFASTEGKSGFLTPVPGGVGPVTIACLLQNVYLAFLAQQRQNRD